jgi:hypothetical protein
MLALEFPLHLSGSVLSRGEGLETRAAINATIIGPVGSRHRQYRAKPGEPQNREGRQHRVREDDPERVAGLFLAGRDAGELSDDELQVALYRGEIGSGLIGLAQCKRVSLRYTHVMAESQLPER